jgi:hypothetical protein
MIYSPVENMTRSRIRTNHFFHANVVRTSFNSSQCSTPILAGSQRRLHYRGALIANIVSVASVKAAN